MVTGSIALHVSHQNVQDYTTNYWTVIGNQHSIALTCYLFNNFNLAYLFNLSYVFN